MTDPRAQLAAHHPPSTAADAAALLAAHIRPVETESIPSLEATLRILAQPITLDRPSPACDVSAMDGYAIRLADRAHTTLPIAGEVQPGLHAPPLPLRSALRIFTGAMIPNGADAVIPREHLHEAPDHIRIPDDLALSPGQHIRHRAENAQAGSRITAPGRLLTPPRLAAAASSGHTALTVHRRIRLGILTTGNEVLRASDHPEPWQLRDGNGPALYSMLAAQPWIDPLPPRHSDDDPRAMRDAIAQLINDCDAVILSGGVSAGDHDHVPSIIRELGCRILFHKLPIRPGKPVLGAVTTDGKPILGLPGNPVSTMVTARLLAVPALRARAGFAHPTTPRTLVELEEETPAPAALTWYPLVRLTQGGGARLITAKGSGDWIAAASSDGFIEVPPGEPARGTRAYTPWSIADADPA